MFLVGNRFIIIAEFTVFFSSVAALLMYKSIVVQERIAARRDRIKRRIDAAKKMSRLMKIQKMMGFKVS